MADRPARKRTRREPEAARAHLLDAARKIMLDEGYAAVGPRRVAQVADVSPTLVHYYYPTTDDLFVALYQQTSGDDLDSLHRALASDNPLEAFWHHQSDETRAALAVEFLAVANHRKALRPAMVAYAERARARQADMISANLAGSGLLPVNCSPLCLATLMAGIGRTLIIENEVGINLGHGDTRHFIAWLLGQMPKAMTDAKLIDKDGCNTA